MMQSVSLGYEYLMKDDDEIISGVTYDAVVLENASCGFRSVKNGKSDREKLDEFMDLLADI
jgi:hypothetical protein